MNPNCLYPNCQSKQPLGRARGLCNTHYQAAYLLVKKGRTTWEDLEKRGKVKPIAPWYAGTVSKWFLED